MVAIFTGAGTGFERGSGNVIGGGGLLGSAAQGRGGDNIFLNAANGNLLISRQDEFLSGRGPDIGINRTYNSLGNFSDDNGDNWRQSMDRRVFGFTGTVNTAGSYVMRRGADGAEVKYSWNGSAYVATDGSGSYDTLTYNGNWTWTDGDSRVTEVYTSLNGVDWQIVSQTDVAGNSLTFTYTGDKLTQVTTADGGYTQLTWSGSNITSLVTYSHGIGLTRTRYSYDGYNRLSTVTVDLTPNDASVGDGNAYTTTYSYHGTSKLVASISQTDGSHVAFTYDGSGRVDSITQTVASGITRTTTIAYGAGYTTVADPMGQAVTLYYDGAGQLTQIASPPAYAGAAAQIVQFGYNGNGDLTSVTDAAGLASTYTYDGNGNVLTAIDRTGNTITRTYNAANQVLTETRMGSDRDSANASHTTRYVYDAANLLKHVVSAEGLVTSYWYNSYGERYWSENYSEYHYDVSGLSSDTALSLAQLTSWWNANPDKTKMQNVQVDYFDARGNLHQRIHYGATYADGNASTADGYTHKYYTYDQAGQLLNRVTATQNTEHFVYDGLGRLTSSTDLNGGVTSIYFNDAATQTTVTLAGGLVQVSTYSKAGELLSVTESGAYATDSTANNAYDANGRLRSATDASGVAHYYLYDKLGRKTAEVNENGNLIEYRYDARNRLVATARFALNVSSTHLALVADPNSTIDVATIRPAVHAYDIWTWHVYDAEGRVLQAIDGDGSTTSYDYDASGQLIRTTGYVNKLTAAQLAAFQATTPTTVVLPPAHANDAVARVFYDKDGRTIGALDGMGYLTRVAYDRAGRKVKEVAYAKATDSALRASGTFQQLINSTGPNPDPANRQMDYVYDGQGLLRYQIDGLGQVTEYGYESDVAWGSIGLARKVTTYATAISFPSGLTFAAVKAAIASSGAASNTANRTS